MADISDMLEKRILRLKLTIAGHISTIRIKHESLEGRYIKLVYEVDKLEERVRNLEKDIESVVFKSVKLTMILITGFAGFVYTLIQIIDFLLRAKL